ncbi:hypothetical protein GCM10029978_092800 [Actinoallomurus acanthiterrae]
MLNVGWLGAGCEFPQSATPVDVIEKLIHLAQNPKNVMRGLHYCEFCEVESPVKVESSTGEIAWLGTGEIHVASPNGTSFVAPTLIIHYILEHRYCPPQPFIDALLVSS